QRLFAHLVDAPADHVFNLRGVDTRTVDQTLECEAEHLDGVPGTELAAPFAKRRAQGADDDRVPRTISGVAVAVVHVLSPSRPRGGPAHADPPGGMNATGSER